MLVKESFECQEFIEVDFLKRNFIIPGRVNSFPQPVLERRGNKSGKEWYNRSIERGSTGKDGILGIVTCQRKSARFTRKA